MTYLTIREFAQTLKISQSFVFKLMREGKLKTVSIGRRTLIPQSEVDRLVQARA